MATYDLNQLPRPIYTALCQFVEACQSTLFPLPARCSHAPEAQACCAACAVTHAAEAILAEAQPAEASRERGAFLRSDLEHAVLEALLALAPLPVTTLQIACLVETGSYRHVRTILQALAMLGTIEHPRKGYYRHRPAR